MVRRQAHRRAARQEDQQLHSHRLLEVANQELGQIPGVL
jgi:hypothetical protein